MELLRNKGDYLSEAIECRKGIGSGKKLSEKTLQSLSQQLAQSRKGKTRDRPRPLTLLEKIAFVMIPIIGFVVFPHFASNLP